MTTRKVMHWASMISLVVIGLGCGMEEVGEPNAQSGAELAEATGSNVEQAEAASKAIWTFRFKQNGPGEWEWTYFDANFGDYVPGRRRWKHTTVDQVIDWGTVSEDGDTWRWDLYRNGDGSVGAAAWYDDTQRRATCKDWVDYEGKRRIECDFPW